MPPGGTSRRGRPSAPITYGLAGSVGNSGEETCPWTATPTIWLRLSNTTIPLESAGHGVGADMVARAAGIDLGARAQSQPHGDVGLRVAHGSDDMLLTTGEQVQDPRSMPGPGRVAMD